ncbi:MAG TPA: MFS transporter [Longimicrobiales bacterium]|nr:MFS transporter [Longimicrobiales bacterium]
MTYNRRLVFTAACLGMLVFGIVLTTLGSILPSLIERFGMDKSSAGSLFFLMSMGILAGSVVFGPIADRFGYKALLIGGLALILAGLEIIAFAPSLAMLRLGIAITGFGGGIVNGCTNAVVADVSEDRKTAGLAILGIFFGIGAVGMPFTLGMFIDTFGYGNVLAGVGALLAMPLVFTAAIRFPGAKHAQGLPLSQGAGLIRQPLLLLLGLMLFLQSGMEITLGGWTATYFNEVLGLEGSQALLYLSLFWFGMMLARLVLGTVLRDMAPARILVVFIGIAFAGVLLLLLSGTRGPAAAGVFLAGAGLAAGFPVILGYVGDRYAALSGTAFSIVLVMALTGGSVLPYATGAMAESWGLRGSLIIVPAALVLQLVLFGVVARRLAAQAVVEPERSIH